MKIRVSDDLLALAAVALAALAAAFSYILPGNPATYVFAMLLIFFLPGYSLTRVIFRNRLRFDMFAFVSIGLSAMMSMLIALVLGDTPILISKESSVFSLFGVVVILLMIDKLLHHESRRFEVDFSMPKKEDVDPVVAVSLIFAVVLMVIVSAIFLTSAPPSTTHVILLSTDHDTDLPQNVSLGVQVNFTVEIMNGEGANAEFGLATYFNGTLRANITDDIANLQTENYSLSVVPDAIGHQKIEVMVYIDGQYYGEVHFWVDVA